MTSIAILLNILAALAFLLARCTSRRGLALPFLAIVLFTTLLTLTIVFRLHPAFHAALLPVPSPSGFFDSFLFVAALLELGLLLPRIPARRTRFLIRCAAALTFAASLRQTYASFAQAPAKPVSANANHHCPQSSPQTCAPAASVSALSYINIATTESVMASLCRTTTRGTTDYNIYVGLFTALQSTPYRVALRECPADQLATPGTLAVISVASHSHALCILSTGNAFIVQDPLHTAPQIWSPQQLAAAYSGIAAIISPAGSD